MHVLNNGLWKRCNIFFRLASKIDPVTVCNMKGGLSIVCSLMLQVCEEFDDSDHCNTTSKTPQVT